ncbi:hypothetical protein [Rhodovibrio salinarum]|uniref:Uncharacterized protein n=1 Tax=Rhodovibrio salinarum TaxID=1087 RepID=A0A934QJF3_9PROT|nr:hypothetical protein [Rhodovibrio salinarum]MBK1698183.1 hypothetical protein [Rhodovibrio salinarum]
MPNAQTATPRANGEIHLAVWSATIAISVEIFTCLFGFVWSLGRMIFDLSDAVAMIEASGTALLTLVLAVLMARMFYRHEREGAGAQQPT